MGTTLSSYTVGFSAASTLNNTGASTGAGGNVYKDTTLNAIINLEAVSSIETLRNAIAIGITLSSMTANGLTSTLGVSGTTANRIGTNTQKFTLNGDVSRVAGVPVSYTHLTLPTTP